MAFAFWFHLCALQNEFLHIGCANKGKQTAYTAQNDERRQIKLSQAICFARSLWLTRSIAQFENDCVSDLFYAKCNHKIHFNMKILVPVPYETFLYVLLSNHWVYSCGNRVCVRSAKSDDRPIGGCDCITIYSDLFHSENRIYCQAMIMLCVSCQRTFIFTA